MKQLALLAAFALALFFLAAGLRPDAFFVGDSGVKLIAAENALDHPTRPLDISLPRIGANPVPHVEPFFAVDGDHAHALTSPIFPLLTAPLLLALGLPGLYVLPALGFLAALAACAAFASSLDARRDPLLTMTVAALATPFLFYGLDFWEHTLALASGTAAAALFLRGRTFSSGLLFGAAASLRPEALWFGVSVVAASRLLPNPPPLRAWIIVASGALVALVPLELYLLMHFGTLAPPHVTVNAVKLDSRWLASRAAIASSWFITGSDTSFWRVAPVVAGAAVSVGSGSRHQGRAFLWSVAIVNVILVVLTAPNDGGGQWGPRYLLFAYVPLAVLAADAIQALPGRSVAAGVAIVAAAIGCLWIQRTGYRQLQSTKTTYGRVVDFVTREAPADGYIVTDLWWLDQVAATGRADRQFLFAPDAGTGRSIVKRLSDLAVPTVTVIRSSSESPDTDGWAEGSCYFEEQRDRISSRSLVAIRLRHRCGP